MATEWSGCLAPNSARNTISGSSRASKPSRSRLVQPRRRHPRRCADESDQDPAMESQSSGSGAVPGSRAAEPPPGCGRPPEQSPRKAAGRRRAARTPTSLPDPASPAPREVRGRPNRPAWPAPPAGAHRQGLRQDPAGGPRRTVLAARCVSGACSAATRATIVVSQAARLSTSRAPARLTPSHASWTASSASASEPSNR